MRGFADGQVSFRTANCAVRVTYLAHQGHRAANVTSHLVAASFSSSGLWLSGSADAYPAYGLLMFDIGLLELVVLVVVVAVVVWALMRRRGR